ncbi:hypothetical protein ACJIZ3_021220 [Penstemon smallii]|uniref:Uncharacterized protein n=1 Tax=Penstemon smallii TaxID=265156 RepID=A0ABD3SLE0_9LAMI
MLGGPFIAQPIAPRLGRADSASQPQPVSHNPSGGATWRHLIDFLFYFFFVFLMLKIIVTVGI